MTGRQRTALRPLHAHTVWRKSRGTSQRRRGSCRPRKSSEQEEKGLQTRHGGMERTQRCLDTSGDALVLLSKGLVTPQSQKAGQCTEQRCLTSMGKTGPSGPHSPADGTHPRRSRAPWLGLLNHGQPWTGVGAHHRGGDSQSGCRDSGKKGSSLTSMDRLQCVAPPGKNICLAAVLAQRPACWSGGDPTLSFLTCTSSILLPSPPCPPE